MQICWEITFHQILNTLNACKYKMCAVITSLFMPHLHCCTCDTYIPVQIDTYIPVHWHLHPCTCDTYIPVHLIPTSLYILINLHPVTPYILHSCPSSDWQQDGYRYVLWRLKSSFCQVKYISYITKHGTVSSLET